MSVQKTIGAVLLVMFTGPVGIILLLAVMGIERWREVGRITVYAIAAGVTGALLLTLLFAKT